MSSEDDQIAQRRANLDAQPCRLIAGVGERVRDTRIDLHHVARARHPAAQPEPEAHLALQNLEALGLDRVHMRDRHRAAGPKLEVEGQQLTVGALRRVREGEALARDRVLQRLSGQDRRPGRFRSWHAVIEYARVETVHSPSA